MSNTILGVQPVSSHHSTQKLDTSAALGVAGCRFVVTQHRQAVAVQDPVQLSRFLELLIGTAGLEEELSAVAAEAGRQAEQYDSLEDSMAG